MRKEEPMSKRVLYLEGNTDGTVGGSYYLMFDLVNRLDRTQYEPIVGFHRDNFLVERFRAAGIETIVFPRANPLNFRAAWLNKLLAPLKRVINVYRGLIAPALLHARFLRDRKIDMINLNNSITRNHPWMLASMLTGTPCVTHEMGLNYSFSLTSRFFGKRLDRVICLSHAIHNAMRDCGIDYPNIQVIHCGIDITRYEIKETPDALRRKHSIPADAPVVGVVGNIRRWKGQETLVRATAQLVRDYPNLRCLLVGDCGEADRAYGEELNRLCREFGIEQNVIFTGFQRNAIDYMELMDVVTHTSIHPEPFGIVTLEAMSRSKPLVSTTIGGPAEVVVSGQSGLLVDAGKPELLAQAIDSFLKDRERAAQIGRAGLERLKSHFSMQKNLDQTMEVYAQVLGADRPQRAPVQAQQV
jgi:glycosyltransferase involved in cell wall biosynthesis